MINLQKQKGFTLIEILLVIAIITLLVSVFTFNSTEARKKANDSHMIQESKEVEKAILLHKESHDGFVPHDTSASWGGVYQEGTDGYTKNLQPLVNSGILPSIPTSPDGSSYAYGISSDGQSAVFAASLNNPDSSGSSGSNDNGACSSIIESEPTNCREERLPTEPQTSWIPSCPLYLASHPDELCFSPEAEFCTAYNQDGDYSSICECIPSPVTRFGRGTTCGLYGGVIAWGFLEIVPSVVCDISENDICSGSFCTCI